MATRARSGADLAVTINANTSAPSNTIVVSSSGNVTTANDLSLSGHLVGYVSNTYLQATFAQNTATASLATDRLQVANAATTYLTKSVALTSNNSLVNLINDREQVANAAVSYVTKAVHLTSNNALINLINDRYQPANLASDLVSYWPSANIIAYVGSAGGGTSMQTNTSIFIASGGETEVAIPYSNTNYLSVKLNGVRLTPGEDYTSANNTHIGNMLALAAADVLTVTEYKQHTANLVNRSSGGGGGGGYSFQGSTSGYTSGGSIYGNSNVIDKFPFSSDSNATDVGDLSVARRQLTGQSSSDNGYSSGGVIPSANVIDKFPFSSDANATDVGDLTVGRRDVSGQSSSTHGYTSGGTDDPSNPSCNIIDKFSFSSDGNATDVGDLTLSRKDSSGQTSSTHGYTSGGIRPENPGPTRLVNPIDKFPFSSDGNATDVGDLLACSRNTSGQSSTTHGYAAGGFTPPYSNVIQKFSFTSDGNATDVGDLTAPQALGAGQSSTTNGYTSGRYPPSNAIEKFPFATDANATDVGDLTVTRWSAAGQQV